MKHELYTTQVLYEKHVSPEMSIVFDGQRTVWPSTTRIEEYMIKEIYIGISLSRPLASEACHKLQMHLDICGAEYKIDRKLARKLPPHLYVSEFVQHPFGAKPPDDTEYEYQFSITEGGLPHGFLRTYVDTIEYVKVEFQTNPSPRGMFFYIGGLGVETLYPLPQKTWHLDYECTMESYSFLFTTRANKEMKTVARLDKIED